MKAKDIKTLDIQAKEWFDGINGNSYFSVNITVNYGLKNSQSFYIPMQYGYGDYYKHAAFDKIKKELNCFKKENSYWQAYSKYNIIVRSSKLENCRKRDL